MGLINWRGAFEGLGGAMERSGRDIAQSTLEEFRQAKLAELQAQAARETHRVNLQTDIAATPARLAAETGGLVEREAALRPGALERARATGDIEVDVARRKPRTIAEGATEIVDGQPRFTAPKTEVPKPQELLDYYAAGAARLNAEADAIRDGLKYKGPVDRAALPQIKVEKDADGNPYMVDAVSGAIGVIRPGAPARPGQTHWFSPNEPGTPAGPPTVDWSLNGQPLRNGLNELYPNMRGGGARVPSSDTGWDPDTGAVIQHGKEIGRVDPRSPTARADAEALLRRGSARRPAATPTQPAATPIPTSAVVPGTQTAAPPSSEGGGLINAEQGAPNLSFAPEWRLRQYAASGNQRAIRELERRRSLYQDNPPQEAAGFPN